MDVTGQLTEGSPMSTGPMGILDHVFKRLMRFKMLNQVMLPPHALIQRESIATLDGRCRILL